MRKDDAKSEKMQPPTNSGKIQPVEGGAVVGVSGEEGGGPKRKENKNRNEEIVVDPSIGKVRQCCGAGSQHFLFPGLDPYYYIPFLNTS